MTWLRNASSEHVSNWLNHLVADIGHRGSSFTDVDGLKLVNDGPTDRFLFIELKDRHEPPISRGQERALLALARCPMHTVIGIRRLTDGVLVRHFTEDWCRHGGDDLIRSVFREFWNGTHQRSRQGGQRCKHRADYQDGGRCRICRLPA